MAFNVGQFLGGPWGGVAAGVLGGLVGGGGPPKELQRLYRLQERAARETQRFARSVPMSDPAERAALAQQRGLLGELQRQQQAELFGALSPTTPVELGDFLGNLSNEQIGAQQQIALAQFLAALARRRQAWGESASIAANAMPAAGALGRGGGTDLGAILQGLAQMHAYREGLRRYEGPGGGTGSPPPGRSGPFGTPGVEVPRYSPPAWFRGPRR